MTALAERRADRRRRLLDAGAEIIGAVGVTGTRVKAVCDHAGLTERYFYETFGGLREFVAAVVEDVAVATATRVLAHVDAVAHDDDASVAETALLEWLTIVDEEPEVARILLVETLTGDPQLAVLRRRVTVGSALALASRGSGSSRKDSGELWRSTATLAAGGTTVDPRLIALAGAVVEIVVARLDGLIATPREELVGQLLAPFVATLGRSAAAARAG